MHAIHLHLYYTDLWPEFRALLEPILARGDVHLYVTITEEEQDFLTEIIKTTPLITVLPNRGLDIGGFIKFWEHIQNKDYLTITKLHGKKSLKHGRAHSFGETWRRNTVAALCGTPEQFAHVTSLAVADPKSCFGARGYIYNSNKDYNNLRYFQNVMPDACAALGVDFKTYVREGIQTWTSRGEFVAGTMFCCSKEYLQTLFAKTDLQALWESLPEGYSDMSSRAHALERIFGWWAEHQGGRVQGV